MKIFYFPNSRACEFCAYNYIFNRSLSSTLIRCMLSWSRGGGGNWIIIIYL